eukprot:CAMPEP_0113316220 /NCGR_PEP_ID=MMETSP0010_2-20120614/11570_1 /TAXON_ID=216773 ORGANISM="Corethron hystrix, Strain 308" /NCGR_SAMPLE_ID=MMETSP0010_2 /ASSEMBLY_ACC=CAM_ASM_000155 /LENGTH=44 /DNA_ID=CAMNT_0000172867 /DNA_START=476 /DNA_END=606 /DNA_ORIENTATION=+ /assembly_acc=CAM_ASM_000155
MPTTSAATSSGSRRADKSPSPPLRMHAHKNLRTIPSVFATRCFP